MATPVMNVSTVMQIGVKLRSIFMTDLPSKMCNNQTTADSSLSFRVCAEKSYHRAQWPIMPRNLRLKFDAKPENNMKSLLPGLRKNVCVLGGNLVESRAGTAARTNSKNGEHAASICSIGEQMVQSP